MRRRRHTGCDLGKEMKKSFKTVEIGRVGTVEARRDLLQSL
jgi:hypothetical protein